MELVFLVMLVLIVLYRISSRALQQEQDEQDDEISAVLIEVQKHGDQIYFWDKVTGDFIIQGKDMTEIAAKCRKYFPEQYFCIEQEDVEKYNLKVKEATVA